jgi:hypothetical protein
VTWIDDTHMRLGPNVYDTAAIQAHYALDDGMCYPVLLTIKPGNDALCLCAEWQENGHTTLTSTKHKKPKEWNLNYINKHFAEQAGGRSKKKRKLDGKAKVA